MSKNKANLAGMLGGLKLGQQMAAHADAAVKTKVEEAKSIQIVPLQNIRNRHMEDTRPAAPKHILSLAESIAALGILQPLALDKKHRLIAGLHRLSAIKLIASSDREEFFNNLGGKVDESIREQLDTLPHLSTLALPLSQGELPCVILDFDSANDTEAALAAEAAENTARKGYSSDEIANIAQKLLNAGYTERDGRPKKGEKALRPTMEMILGMTSKQVRHALDKARSVTSSEKNLPKGQVFEKSKYLSSLSKASIKSLQSLQAADMEHRESLAEILNLLEQLNQAIERHQTNHNI